MSADACRSKSWSLKSVRLVPGAWQFVKMIGPLGSLPTCTYILVVAL